MRVIVNGWEQPSNCDGDHLVVLVGAAAPTPFPITIRAGRRRSSFCPIANGLRGQAFRSETLNNRIGEGARVLPFPTLCNGKEIIFSKYIFPVEMGRVFHRFASPIFADGLGRQAFDSELQPHWGEHADVGIPNSTEWEENDVLFKIAIPMGYERRNSSVCPIANGTRGQTLASPLPQDGSEPNNTIIIFPPWEWKEELIVLSHRRWAEPGSQTPCSESHWHWDERMGVPTSQRHHHGA
jgi:hypothetical protein